MRVTSVLFWFLFRVFQRDDIGLVSCYPCFSFAMNFQREKPSLNWHKCSDHVRNMMKELIVSTEFSDVTLICEDKKQLRAHKNILGACSNFFREIFKSDKSAHQMIYLRGIQFSEMESIMQFVYLGEAKFKEERIQEFFAVAESLEIKGLEQKVIPSKSAPKATFHNDRTEDFLAVAEILENKGLEQKNVPSKIGLKPTFHNDRTEDFLAVADSLETKGVKQKNVPSKIGLRANFHEGRREEFLAVAESLEIKGLLQKVIPSKSAPKTTFHENKAEEFLAVAESLEIEGLEQKNELSKSATQNYTNPIQELEEPSSMKIAAFQDQTEESLEIKGHKQKDELEEPDPMKNTVFSKKDHSENLRYSCGQCGKDFVTQQVLKTHTESVHEGILHACDHCVYQATEKSSLRRHIKVKHNGTEYKCQLCEFKTSRKRYFNTHIKSTVHNFKS